MEVAAILLGIAIGKLTFLLTENYKLAKDVEHGIGFLKDELSNMDAVLRISQTRKMTKSIHGPKSGGTRCMSYPLISWIALTASSSATASKVQKPALCTKPCKG
ncbi:unnamed protein product [Urochloa humidicola]